jgi:hypothetical protein
VLEVSTHLNLIPEVLEQADENNFRNSDGTIIIAFIHRSTSGLSCLF